MSAARKGSSSGSGARKPAAVSTRPASTPSGSTTASTTAARKPRKPALDRALKLSQQVAKKCSALVKQAAKWRGDCTAEQKMARDQIVEALSLFKQPAETLTENLAFLQRSNWKPTVAGPNRKVLNNGELVCIREKYYDSEAHGPNLFEVSKSTDKSAMLRNRTTKASVTVPKSWVDKIEAMDGTDDKDDAA